VFEDPEQTRLAAVSHWIYTSTAAAVVIASVLALFQSYPLPALLSFAFTEALLLACIGLVRRGDRDAASMLFLVVGWAIVTFNLVLDGGLRSASILGYPLLVLIAGVLMGSRGAYALAVVGPLTTLGVLAMEAGGLLLPADPIPALGRFWTGIVLSCFLSALIVVLVQRSLRSAENNRARLEAQIERSQRLEALGRLAGGIAHDFNNYLTVILGNTQVLTEKPPTEADLRQSLSEIEAAAERSATLIRKLLTFSRSEPSSPRVFDPRRFLTEMEEMLSRILGEQVEIQTIVGEAGGNVRIDPALLETSLMNLAVNARDAMPGGGTLTLSASPMELGPEQARRLSLPEPGPYMTIAVSDTGEGISEANQARLFEPFYTTKAPGKGTGLGLAMVHGTVRSSGGAIEVESEPSHGTTFRIYLPRVEEREELVASERPLARTLAGGETVLVVEDEQMVRSFMEGALRALGYMTLEAADGREALDLSSHYDGVIDLLITDVIMPQMGGVELASRLIETRPQLKVLFVSGYTGAASGSQRLVEPDVALLPKPFTAAQLLERVHRRLHGEARHGSS
jgi:signal transduction histidine kinase/ActR/RegA family two-component response regulator